MKKELLFGLLLFLCFTLVGCKKKESIIGKWVYSTAFEYVFNEDKTCSYVGKKCTYAIDNDKLFILYEGNTDPFETTFKIENNKLIIKDSLGSDVVYERK